MTRTVECRMKDSLGGTIQLTISTLFIDDNLIIYGFIISICDPSFYLNALISTYVEIETIIGVIYILPLL